MRKRLPFEMVLSLLGTTVSALMLFAYPSDVFLWLLLAANLSGVFYGYRYLLKGK